MKIDLRQPVLNHIGRPFLGQDGNPQTVRELFFAALNETPQGESLDGKQKYDIARLIFKIFKVHQAELTLEEIALLKDRIGKVFINPVAVARLWDLLEGRKPEKILPEEDLKASGAAESSQ